MAAWYLYTRGWSVSYRYPPQKKRRNKTLQVCGAVSCNKQGRWPAFYRCPRPCNLRIQLSVAESMSWFDQRYYLHSGWADYKLAKRASMQRRTKISNSNRHIVSFTDPRTSYNRILIGIQTPADATHIEKSSGTKLSSSRTVFPARLHSTAHLSFLKFTLQTASDGLESSRIKFPVLMSQSLTLPSFPPVRMKRSSN
jgi:hypothetical protein